MFILIILCICFKASTTNVYGQLLVPGDGVLDFISFYASIPNTTVFTAYLCEWDGEKAITPCLFNSGNMSTTTPFESPQAAISKLTFFPVRYTKAHQVYVFFFQALSGTGDSTIDNSASFLTVQNIDSGAVYSQGDPFSRTPWAQLSYPRVSLNYSFETSYIPEDPCGCCSERNETNSPVIFDQISDLGGTIVPMTDLFLTSEELEEPGMCMCTDCVVRLSGDLLYYEQSIELEYDSLYIGTVSGVVLVAGMVLLGVMYTRRQKRPQDFDMLPEESSSHIFHRSAHRTV